MYFSIESNEPTFLSMDTDESEFSAFPHESAGVARKLIIKKNHAIPQYAESGNLENTETT